MATITEDFESIIYPGKRIAFIAYSVQWAKFLALEELARLFRDRYPEDSALWEMEDHGLHAVLQEMNKARLIMQGDGFKIEDIEAEAINLREELSVHGLLCRSSISDDTKAAVAIQAGLPPCL